MESRIFWKVGHSTVQAYYFVYTWAKVWGNETVQQLKWVTNDKWRTFLWNFPNIYELFYLFLAAMSSSRSDNVTKCVFMFVQSIFLVRSFQSIWSKMFQGCYKGVSWASQRSLKGQGIFKRVSRVFQEHFKGVSGMLKGWFIDMRCVFQGSLKGY